MKRTLLIQLIVIVFLFSFENLFSQENSPWKWVHPTPQGNTLRKVRVFNAATWYALGYGNTFLKTTNAGANWFINTAVMGERENTQVSLYDGWFFSMTTGLACGSSGKISRTTNSGLTWDTVSTPSTGTLYGMHFINSTTGFVSTSSGGDILKTTDAGLTWTAISTGSSATLYNIFALDADNIYVSTTSGNMRKTTNGGSNWTIHATGGSTLYDVFFKSVDTGFVCGSSTNIRKTVDGGANWTLTSTGLPSTTLYELTYASNTLYASGNSSWVFRSTNDGQTWDSLAFAGNQYYTSTYYCLDRNASTMLTAGAFGLINSSTNAGVNWVAHNYLGYASTLNDIWCSSMNGNVIAVGSASPVQILFSSNGGNTWSFTASENLGTVTCYGIDMVNNSTGYVSASTSWIFKTTDGGQSWDTNKVYSTSTTLYCTDFIDVNTGWVSGSSGRVLMTTDGSATWTLQTTGTTSSLYKISMVNSTTGWISGSSGTCRKTTDGGTTWTAQTSNTSSTLYEIQMQNANSGYLCGSSGTLRKTTNGGTDWDTVNTPFTQTQYGLYFINMNTGFVTGSTGYTIRTSNGGSSWEILNTSGSSMNEVFVKGYDSAYTVGSSGAIFKLYNALTGGVTWNNQVPMDYILHQNYPNPFNPSTTIKFGLPKTSRVTLKIFDITGREVDILFNNTELNAGTLSYVFDGSNFASGVYFYSLVIDGNLFSSKKMILVK